ncbi:MAG: biotin synthase, partial [Clostridia bacterium]
METKEKLRILAESAKYDAACTSSGSDRKNTPGGIGTTTSSGCCHAFSSDGRCISLLKVLFTNYCINDCKYCLCRHSNDIERAAFEPREL